MKRHGVHGHSLGFESGMSPKGRGNVEIRSKSLRGRLGFGRSEVNRSDRGEFLLRYVIHMQ
jgi:hypothetical protein